LPKLRIFRDKALREKYKLFHLIEKLLKVWYYWRKEKLC
jgi:hypothetical protein